MKAFYDLWYRFGRPPWVMGARAELVQLVDDGCLRPGRALDLGCGEGDNSIFLAGRGFDVTGVDFAPSAVSKARAKAAAAGVGATFVVDDLTRLRNVRGTFDLLVDYGTLDDLSHAQRDRYIDEVVPLTHAGTQFLLWCFEWDLLPWERALTALLPFGRLALAPGEAHRRFSDHFDIEVIAQEHHLTGWPRGYAAYLMTRRSTTRAPV